MDMLTSRERLGFIHTAPPPSLPGSCGQARNFTVDANATVITNITSGLEEEDDAANSVRSFENTTLFYVSCFQYVAVTLAFAKGWPFRLPTHTNGMGAALPSRSKSSECSLCIGVFNKPAWQLRRQLLRSLCLPLLA